MQWQLMALTDLPLKPNSCAPPPILPCCGVACDDRGPTGAVVDRARHRHQRLVDLVLDCVAARLSAAAAMILYRAVHIFSGTRGIFPSCTPKTRPIVSALLAAADGRGRRRIICPSSISLNDRHAASHLDSKVITAELKLYARSSFLVLIGVTALSHFIAKKRKLLLAWLMSRENRIVWLIWLTINDVLNPVIGKDKRTSGDGCGCTRAFDVAWS